MRLTLLALLLVLLAACTSPPTPYSTMHAAPRAEAVPAPTPEHPNAYNYLPAVLGGFCSEAEYPLFAALNQQPLSATRPLLEKLGLIRDHQMMPFGNFQMEKGWQDAINSRHRLTLRQEFATRDGSRIAWLFAPSIMAQSAPANWPFVVVLTTADYRVVTYKTVPLHGVRPRNSVPPQPSEVLIWEFPSVHPKQVDQVRITASAVELSRGIHPTDPVRPSPATDH